MAQPDHATVLATRIWLAKNIQRTLTRSEVLQVTGSDLLLYMEAMPRFPSFQPPSGSPVPRTAREIRDFMSSNRELVEAYERAKAANNKSGRTSRIHRRGGPVIFD